MGFVAETHEIKTFSDQMKQKWEAINGMIARADTLAQNVNSPAFQGEAGTAFQNTMTRYLDAARRMNTQLHDSSDRVAAVAATITDEEANNAKDILAAQGPALDMSS
ncbi:WXG100 family type VII secretion target [Nocardia sp. NPDC050378]|uniref:WXG100 family type VII secretion target n=1 Tax=Nocardia sp. NPDC050378 TaxID=3155400 RepID=UPI0033CA3489